jgi:hypothetical protein
MPINRHCPSKYPSSAVMDIKAKLPDRPVIPAYVAPVVPVTPAVKQTKFGIPTKPVKPYCEWVAPTGITYVKDAGDMLFLKTMPYYTDFSGVLHFQYEEVGYETQQDAVLYDELYPETIGLHLSVEERKEEHEITELEARKMKPKSMNRRQRAEKCKAIDIGVTVEEYKAMMTEYYGLPRRQREQEYRRLKALQEL